MSVPSGTTGGSGPGRPGADGGPAEPAAGPGARGGEGGPGGPIPERKFPPIAEIAMAALAIVIVGGIYLASHLPEPVSLAPAWILAGIATAMVLVNVVLLARLRDFNWEVFYRVAGWSLLAYLVIAGMLGFIFIYDHTRGATLGVLVLSLAIFAVDIPMLFGFSVARYQPVGEVAAAGPAASPTR